MKNIIYLEIVISCVIDGANGMSLACKGKIAIVFQINRNNCLNILTKIDRDTILQLII